MDKVRTYIDEPETAYIERAARDESKPVEKILSRAVRARMRAIPRNRRNSAVRGRSKK